MNPQKTMLIKRSLVFLFVGLVAFLALTYPYEKPRDKSLPSYITDIWPPPNDEVWGHWYALSLKIPLPGPFPGMMGISVGIDTSKGIRELELVEKAKPAISLPLENRVNLYLDDAEIQADDPMCYNDMVAALEPAGDKSYGAPLGRKYRFCWPVSLTPGKHTAKLSIATRSGEVLEYVWVFTIK
jgi:hypothetical protein